MRIIQQNVLYKTYTIVTPFVNLTAVCSAGSTVTIPSTCETETTVEFNGFKHGKCYIRGIRPEYKTMIDHTKNAVPLVNDYNITICLSLIHI